VTEARGVSVLLVDDDAVFRGRMARALTERGLDVREAGDAGAAIAAAEEESPEYAVVDLRLPGASGLTLVAALQRIDPATRVLVLTGYGSIATAVEAVRGGALDYLTKPADADDVVRAFGLGSADGEARESGDGGHAYTTPTLARVEWEHIHRVLADCEGNVSEAARRLGLHRRSLQRKLAKFPARR
jgi:two-component system response regulator RegA